MQTSGFFSSSQQNHSIGLPPPTLVGYNCQPQNISASQDDNSCSDDWKILLGFLGLSIGLLCGAAILYYLLKRSCSRSHTQSNSDPTNIALLENGSSSSYGATRNNTP